MSQLFQGSPVPEKFSPNEKKNQAAPGVPPPPGAADQVTIRTLASDLELMGKGNRPTAGNAPALSLTPPPPPRSLRTVSFWLGGGALGALLLFFLGYYLLPLLLNSVPRPTSPAAPAAPAASSSLPAATTPVSFAHTSFFRIAADRFVPLALQASLQTYPQLVQAALASIPSSAAFVEFSLSDRAGNFPSWTGMTGILGANLLPAAFWQENFEADFTPFAYRNATGTWPGYVLKLRPNRSPLVLRSAVAGLESATSSLENLFVSVPGIARGSFADAQSAGEPVRARAYENTSLVYGWALNKYLVVSASLEGYREAVRRL